MQLVNYGHFQRIMEEIGFHFSRVVWPLDHLLLYYARSSFPQKSTRANHDQVNQKHNRDISFNKLKIDHTVFCRQIQFFILKLDVGVLEMCETEDINGFWYLGPTILMHSFTYVGVCGNDNDDTKKMRIVNKKYRYVYKYTIYKYIGR